MGLPEIGAVSVVPPLMNANMRTPITRNAGPLPALTEHRHIGYLQLATTPGRLEVDSTVPRQEMGYFALLPMTRQGWQYTEGKVRKAIDAIVAAGDRLQAAHTGENVIAALAFERMFIESADRRVELGFIPRTPPSIRYTPGTLKIDLVY